MSLPVITGIGLITPLGSSPEVVLAAIEAGRCAAAPPTRFDASPFACRVCAEIHDFDPAPYIPEVKTLRMMNRDAQLAVAAARLALRDANLVVGRDYASEDVGLFGATGLAGIALSEVARLVEGSAGPNGELDLHRFGAVALKQVRPVLSFKILSNMPICFVSIFESLRGINAVYNPWEGHGAQAIAAGAAAIERGETRAVLVGGCDVKTHELGFIALEQWGALRGWHTHGAGPIPGEGAAFLVLEAESSARTRGARIYARLAGHARATTDGTEANRRRAHESIRQALAGHAMAGVVAAGDEPTALEPRASIFPKRHMGDLFAAAAPAQVALAAAMASRLPAGECVLASCFGHGPEQAAFLVESWASGGRQPRQPPGLPHDQPASQADQWPDGHRSPGLPRRESPAVVITGLGIVSPVGNTPVAFWDDLTAGRSGIAPLTLFDASRFPVRIGGEVKGLDLAALAGDFPLAARERDRKVWLGLAAARQALADAGLAPADLAAAAVHVGVGLEAFFLEDMTRALATGGIGTSLSTALTRAVAEGKCPPVQTPLDRLAQLIAGHFGIGGPQFTNCSACAAGAQAIGEALRLIQNGEREIALAGAADSMLNPLGLGGFSLLRILSTDNDHPDAACRPFDAAREGTVLGEGAAFLVLETLEHARRRGARIYARLAGYGSSMDAYRLSDPDPTAGGAALAMTKALRDAHLAPADIDAVNAHGTGTPKNDIVETAAIKDVLGSRAREIPIHAVKSMTGHLIGASGAVEAVAAVLSLVHAMIPPTINLHSPDPLCDLDYVPHTARPFTGRTILSNSFAFGGQNATLIFTREP